MAFERPAYEIARTQSHRERKRKHDSSEQNAEGQLDYVAADLEMIENHGRSQHQHQPLDSEREKARVLELRIYRADEHSAGQESGDSM